MITVEHLTKCYGGFTAVSDLSFEMKIMYPKKRIVF
jgi:ABC-type multidrug transport system ATPase subunit